MKAQKAIIKDLTERLKEKEMALNSASLQNTGLKDNEQELMRALATNEKNYEESLARSAAEAEAVNSQLASRISKLEEKYEGAREKVASLSASLAAAEASADAQAAAREEMRSADAAERAAAKEEAQKAAVQQQQKVDRLREELFSCQRQLEQSQRESELAAAECKRTIEDIETKRSKEAAEFKIECGLLREKLDLAEQEQTRLSNLAKEAQEEMQRLQCELEQERKNWETERERICVKNEQQKESALQEFREREAEREDARQRDQVKQDQERYEAERKRERDKEIHEQQILRGREQALLGFVQEAVWACFSPFLGETTSERPGKIGGESHSFERLSMSRSTSVGSGFGFSCVNHSPSTAEASGSAKSGDLNPTAPASLPCTPSLGDVRGLRSVWKGRSEGGTADGPSMMDGEKGGVDGARHDWLRRVISPDKSVVGRESPLLDTAHHPTRREEGHAGGLSGEAVREVTSLSRAVASRCHAIVMAVEARVLHACRTAEEERARDERARRDEADRFKAAAHVHTENELQASRQVIKDKEVELAAALRLAEDLTERHARSLDDMNHKFDTRSKDLQRVIEQQQARWNGHMGVLTQQRAVLTLRVQNLRTSTQELKQTASRECLRLHRLCSFGVEQLGALALMRVADADDKRQQFMSEVEAEQDERMTRALRETSALKETVTMLRLESERLKGRSVKLPSLCYCLPTFSSFLLCCHGRCAAAEDAAEKSKEELSREKEAKVEALKNAATSTEELEARRLENLDLSDRVRRFEGLWHEEQA